MRSKLVLFYLSVLFLFNCYVKCQDGPKVKTTYGWIEGKYSSARGGKEIITFVGIKYAKEPTGQLRFKSPQATDAWEGVKPATRQCSMCPQPLLPTSPVVTGAENCLCLNVFTPQIHPKSLFPVVVFLHGGAYLFNSSDTAIYGPELFLAKADIVLVTLNYRLGVLGFLSTEDDVVPGNWAMKDQRLALRWVRDNIAQFGGDPHSVTLMGQSSGAASAQLHSLSPASRGLFHRVIAHSASARALWSVAEPGDLRAKTYYVAKKLGCPTSPSLALLKCMQKVPAKDIVATTKDFIVWDNDPIILWNPVVEPSSVKDAFLTVHPRMLNFSIPLLTGFTNAEGGVKALRMTSGNVKEKFQQWNNDFERLTAISMFYDKTAPDPRKVTKKIREYYFGSVQQITKDMTPQITRAYGDMWFINDILDTVERNRDNTYLYYLNYNSSTKFSFIGAVLKNPLYLGTCHFDDLPYFFPMGGTFKMVDSKLSQILIEMWTNFIKKLEPSPVWKPVSSSALEYLDINNKGITMKNCPFRESRKFYKNITFHKETPEETLRNHNILSEWSRFCHD